MSIQFNAHPQELLSFVRDIVAAYRLHIVRITFPPYKAEEISERSLDSLFDDVSKGLELAFSIVPPSLPVAGSLEFYDRNPDALSLEVGKFDAQGLTESQLSAETRDIAAMSIWKKVAKRLRSITTEGATATNPRTGHSGPAASQRFTAGAIKLWKKGVPLLTVTGIQLTPAEGVHPDAGSHKKE